MNRIPTWTLIIVFCLSLTTPLAASDTLEVALQGLEERARSADLPSKEQLQSLSADLTRLEEGLKQAATTEEIELGEWKKTNLREKQRLLEARRLLAEERRDRLERLRDGLRRLQEDEARLTAADAESLAAGLADWVRLEARWTEERTIGEEKWKLAAAQTELHRTELTAFRDKVEALRRAVNAEREARVPDERKDAAARRLELRETLLAVQVDVTEYLAERLAFEQEILELEKEFLARQADFAGRLREKLLPLGEEKIADLRKKQAAARVGSEAEEKRFVRAQKRLQQGDRQLERRIAQLEEELASAEARSRKAADESLARLIRENPRLALSVARMEKENFRLGEENLNLLRNAARAVAEWEERRLRLEQGQLSDDELAAFSTEADAQREKYVQKIHLGRDEEQVLRREADSTADEAEELSRRMEAIRAGRETSAATQEVLLRLEEKQSLLFARLEQQEERIVLTEKRREAYERRLRELELFRGAVRQSGAIVIFGNRLEQIFHFLLALCATLLVALLLVRGLFHWILRRTAASSIQVDHILARVVSRPLILAVMILGFYFSLGILHLPLRLYDNLLLLVRGLFVLNVAWLVMRAVDIVVHFVRPLVEKTASRLDDQLLPVVARLAKFLIITVGLIVFVESFGYPATSILTGLGIGGLAFALAAKDTLANFFGSMVIFSDKIFSIGDWIKFGDNEGIVEEIGLRSTAIRKFDDTVIIVPNSTVAQSNITNISRFRKRRIYYNLGLTYDSGPEGMSRGVDIVRSVLDDHPEVANDHYVFFTDFGPYSLDIMVYCFAETTVWREYMRIRQEVNIEIMRRLEAAGLSIAFPTRTLNFDEDALAALGARERPCSAAEPHL